MRMRPFVFHTETIQSGTHFWIGAVECQLHRRRRSPETCISGIKSMHPVTAFSK
jgi:hypothetical protein